MIIIKTNHEIEYMRKSGRIVGETLAMLQELVKPGITTAELDIIAEEYIIKCVQYHPLKGITASHIRYVYL